MDLSKYLHDSAARPSLWWAYRFPNGHDATVIPDPHYRERPFLFEVESTDPDDLGSGRVVAGLTSEQVVAKLERLAGLPRNDEAQ